MADGNNKIAVQAVAHTSLYGALCTAQAQFKEVIKSTEGLHKAKYAPLDKVIEAIMPALNSNGLVLSQPTRIADGALILETQIIHAATGEVLSCQYPVAGLGGQHQQIGASLTYARRYSLLALCGVAPENEDDAETKESAPTGKKQPAPAKQAEQKITPPAPKVYTLDERVTGCKAHLSKAKDSDDAIVRWEEPRTEQLRMDLEREAPDKLAALSDYYGQVLSRFEGAFA